MAHQRIPLLRKIFERRRFSGTDGLLPVRKNEDTELWTPETDYPVSEYEESAAQSSIADKKLKNTKKTSKVNVDPNPTNIKNQSLLTDEKEQSVFEKLEQVLNSINENEGYPIIKGKPVSRTIPETETRAHNAARKNPSCKLSVGITDNRNSHSKSKSLKSFIYA